MATIIAALLAYWIVMAIMVSSASIVVGVVYAIVKIIEMD